MPGTEPIIVVIAHDRPRSLSRLLRSLANADLLAGSQLVISIDGDGSPDCVDIAKEYAWPAGDKKVIHHQRKLGLRNHVLACGDLSQEYGPVILLEDDTLVSRVFFNFVSKALANYATEDRIAGISLYSQRHNETARCVFEPMNNGFSVFLSQLPSSWGEVFSPDQWIRFRRWLRAHESNLDITSLPWNVQQWPEDSWKKLMTAYVAATDRWFVYPYVGFSTNFGESGAHALYRSDSFHSELASDCHTFLFPTVEQAVKYDLWWELVVSEVEWDVYGTKPVLRGQYVLSPRRLPGYRQTEGFGLELRPIQMNYYLHNEGDAFWMNERLGDGECRPIEPTDLVTRRLAQARMDWVPTRSLLALIASRMRRRLQRTPGAKWWAALQRRRSPARADYSRHS